MLDTRNNFLNSALQLASRGFHVFPLQPNSKLPALKGYPTRATTDEKQIREWWGKRPQCNIGISTSSFNGGDSALIAVDIDNKGEKKGDDEILRLELEGREFPPTFTQRTPTGGKHLVYRCKRAVRQSAGAIAAGIDSRSQGGYIVGAGSALDGRVYTIESNFESNPEWTPDWLFQYHVDRESQPTTYPQHEPPTTIDTKRAQTRAAEWLTTAPLALQGASGDQTTFRVAAKLKDFGLSKEEACSLLAYPGGWNDRCSPPWDLAELAQKVRNAYAYGQHPIGVAAPETEFSKISPSPAGAQDRVPDSKEARTADDNAGGAGGFYLEEMNKKYALVFESGGHYILEEAKDERGASFLKFHPEQSFKRKLSTHTVIPEGGKRAVSWADAWLDWRDRREFNGICFRPELPARNGYYNTWRGFSVKPIEYTLGSELAKKGFDRFQEHTRENICGGDPVLANWLMGYFAHLIQRPFERPLTTLVFKGPKGTGKNALVDRIGRLLGEKHYLVAHDKRYLMSNFNAHMEECLMLVLDEAFWSGEKDAEGKLKGLTTESRILIERKGRESYKADNLARLVVIGNEDWVIPASEDERRYAVFQVGVGRQRDNEYFQEMREWLDLEGGSAILLNYLKNFPLSEVDVNRAPATQALYEQKIASQEPFADWWLDCLSAGRIVGSDFSEKWEMDVPKEGFRQAYARHVKERNLRIRIPSEIGFSKLLSNISAGTKFNQKKRDGDKVFNIFRLPTLEAAREEWDHRMRHKTTWDTA